MQHHSVEGVVCIYETSDAFPYPNYPFGGQKRVKHAKNIFLFVESHNKIMQE